MYKKTRGLVIREFNYKESDKLLTVLTEGEGKLTLKARGVRRKGGKYKSAAQLFAYSEFTLFEYKGYYTINEAETIEMFSELQSDLELLSLAFYFAEVLDKVGDEDRANPEILFLALNALFALCKQKKTQELVKAVFELKLMCLSGYEPLLESCAVCGNEMPDRFQLAEGILHCAGCRDQAAGGISMPIRAGSLLAMRHIVYGDPKKIFSFSIGKDAMSELCNCAEAYLITQLERGFSTLDFYKQLKALPDPGLARTLK